MIDQPKTEAPIDYNGLMQANLARVFGERERSVALVVAVMVVLEAAAGLIYLAVYDFDFVALGADPTALPARGAGPDHPRHRTAEFRDDRSGGTHLPVVLRWRAPSRGTSFPRPLSRCPRREGEGKVKVIIVDGQG